MYYIIFHFTSSSDIRFGASFWQRVPNTIACDFRYDVPVLKIDPYIIGDRIILWGLRKNSLMCTNTLYYALIFFPVADFTVITLLHRCSILTSDELAILALIHVLDAVVFCKGVFVDNNKVRSLPHSHILALHSWCMPGNMYSLVSIFSFISNTYVVYFFQDLTHYFEDHLYVSGTKRR